MPTSDVLATSSPSSLQPARVPLLLALICTHSLAARPRGRWEAAAGLASCSDTVSAGDSLSAPQGPPRLPPLRDAASPQGSKPNVVVIYGDDLGYGDLEAFGGHPTSDTPSLDALLRAGLRLNSIYTSSPVCSPSRSSVRPPPCRGYIINLRGA